MRGEKETEKRIAVLDAGEPGSNKTERLEYKGEQSQYDVERGEAGIVGRRRHQRKQTA